MNQKTESQERYQHGLPFHTDFFVVKNNEVVKTSAYGSVQDVQVDYSKQHNTAEPANRYWRQHGANDDIPLLLRKFYKDVALNKRAISFKASGVYGAGLSFETVDERFVLNSKTGRFMNAVLNMSESQKLAEIQKAKLWAKNINLSAFHKKFSNEIALYGGCFSRVSNFKNIGGNRETYRLQAVSPVVGRIGAEYDLFSDETTHHYFSEKFGNVSNYMIANKVVNLDEYSKLKPSQKKRGNYIVEIPTIGNKDAKKTATKSSYIGNITPDRAHYATPDYENTEYVYYSEIVLEKAKHNKSDIKNNLGLTKIITIFRNKLQDEKAELAKRQAENEAWRTKLRGSENQGSFIIDRVEPATDKGGKPIRESSFLINTIPDNNTTDRYNSLEKSANVILLTSHGIIDPKVAGIPNLSSVGLSSQMEFFVAAIEQMDNGIIKTYSDLECDFLTELAQKDGLAVKVKRKKSLPLYRAMVADLMKLVLDDNEIREIYGFAQMTENQREEIARRVAERQNSKSTSNK